MKPPSQNATQVLRQSNFGFTSMIHVTTVAKRNAEPFKRFISKRAPVELYEVTICYPIPINLRIMIKKNRFLSWPLEI